MELTPEPAERISAAEIAALLLMGVGGIVLPLLAPAVGVVLMRTTPRWTAQQVRSTWAIIGGGFVALLLGFLMLFIAEPGNTLAVSAGLLALGLVVVVGPAAALYAAFCPRP